MQRLENKTALITGGNSGIGKAVAALFVQEGARVMIAARDEAKGWQTVDNLKNKGADIAFVRCDVRQPQDCIDTATETLRVFGQIDILFNNAGIVPSGTVTETSLEVWNDVLATNVSGTFYMSRAVLPHMIEQGS